MSTCQNLFQQSHSRRVRCPEQAEGRGCLQTQDVAVPTWDLSAAPHPPPPYPQQILWAFKQLPCRRIHLVSPPTPPPIGFHWTRPSDTSMEPMGPSPPARAEMTGPTDNTKVFCPSACQHGVWTSRQCCWRYLLWISQIQQLLQLVLEILRRKAAVNRVTHLKIVVNQCPNHKLLTLWALLWQNCLQFFMQIKLYN